MRALGEVAQVSLQSAVRVILLPLVAVELGRGPGVSRVIVASLVVCAVVTAASSKSSPRWWMRYEGAASGAHGHVYAARIARTAG